MPLTFEQLLIVEVILVAGVALLVAWVTRSPGTRVSDLLGLTDPPEDDECPPTP